MTKNQAVSSIAFINTLLGSEELTFGGVRHLQEALKKVEPLQKQLTELRESKAKDKEEGLKAFLAEDFEFEPIPATLFDSVSPVKTGLFLLDENGKKRNEPLNYVQILQILQSFGVIK